MDKMDSMIAFEEKFQAAFKLLEDESDIDPLMEVLSKDLE
jgi:hypothetical protein